MTSYPKPEPRKKTKARERREESAVVQKVRAKVEKRDGDCRLHSFDPRIVRMFGPCSGQSEWAHLGEKKRARTRGMDPSLRHTTAGSCMFCTGHHQGPRGYDSGGFDIKPLTGKGADGPMRFIVAGEFYDEPDEDIS